MPPPPGLYQANFTALAIVAGFDIITSTYGEQRVPNATIRSIPWAAGNPTTFESYAVVVQAVPYQLRRRTYKALVYLETHYDALSRLVGEEGTLLTPREPITFAILDSVHRAEFQDPGTTTGPQTLDLTFTLTFEA